MTDMAVVGLAVDATGAERGTVALDNLTNAAKRAEGATKGVSAASEILRGAATGSSTATDRLSRATAEAAAMADRMAQEAGEAGRALSGMSGGARAASTATGELERAAREAAEQLDRQERELREVTEAARRAQAGLVGAADSTRRLGTASSDLDRRLGDVRTRTMAVVSATHMLAGAFATLGVGLLIREYVELSDTYTAMESKLKLVTSTTQELARAQQGLYEIAQNARAPWEGTVDLFGRIARSTKDLGVSQEATLQVTETINKAIAISGSSAASTNAALVQLGQGFASGTLRGQELNSVMEQTPRVAQAIADGLGVPLGKLRELGKDGKLVSSDLIVAFLLAGEEIRREFEDVAPTVSKSLTTLKNSATKAVGEFDKASGATASLIGVIDHLTAVIEGNEKITWQLDLALKAVAVTAGVLAVRSIAGMTASVVTSTVAAVTGTAAWRAYMLSIALVGPASATASAASLALGAAIRFALGPVGLMITAIGLLTGAWYAYDQTAGASTSATKALVASVNETTKAIEQERIAASLAAQEQGKMPKAFEASEIATASLTGEVGKLGDAYYRAAVQAKNLRLEDARRKASDARAKAEELEVPVNAQVDAVARQSIYRNALPVSALPASVRQRAQENVARTAVGKALADAEANARYYEEQVKSIEGQRLDDFKIKRTPSEPDKPKKASRAMSEGDRATDRLREEILEINRLNAAYDALNASVMDGTTTYEEAERQGRINGELARWQAELDDISAKKAGAKGKALADLNRQYDDLTKEVDLYRAALEEQQRIDAVTEILKASEAIAVQNRALEQEISLIGLSNLERERAIALMQTQEALRKAGLKVDPNDPLGSDFGAAVDFAVASDKNAGLGEKKKAGEFLQGAREDADQDALKIGIDIETMNMSRESAAAYRREIELLNEAKRQGIPLDQQQREEIKGIAQAYGHLESIRIAQEATEDWRRSLKGVFDDLRTGATTVEGAIERVIAKLLEMAATKAFDKLWEAGLGDWTSGGLGWLGLGGTKSGTAGAGSQIDRALSEVQSFDGGGYTGDGPRSGGLDGKGGRMAMVHPRETIIDHTREVLSRPEPQYVQPVNITIAPRIDVAGAVIHTDDFYERLDAGMRAVANDVGRKAKAAAVGDAAAKMRVALPGAQAQAAKWGV